MNNIFILAYPYIFLILFTILLILSAYRWLYWQPIRCQSAVASYLLKKGGVRTRHISQYVFFAIRFLVLLFIIIAISRPQSIDPASKVCVEGVDIVLVLDASDSMRMFDNLSDRCTRIEIAKKEAINFINRRQNDPIGLVLFGRYAISRCPLTLDKEILRQIINKTEVGEIDPAGTMLSLAMMTAINRLKMSQAKSKIMIVLTDGQPTPGDVEPQIVIDIAKKLDIKIYTVGIGSKDGGYFEHPFYGVVRQGEVFNAALLKQLAETTGGQFFQAKSADDMHQVYSKIDQLEKTDHQTSVFTKKYELFGIFILFAVALLLLESFLYYFVWFGIV